MIHTFGDSHASFGWGSNVKRHDISSMLCYTFGKQPYSRFDITTFNIQDNDIVIFCFGEVDCRCHIHKHITDSLPYTKIIDAIIEDYIASIKLNVMKLNKKLKHVCIYNVVPPVRNINPDTRPEYPYQGSREEQKAYVLYFNKKVKEQCLANNYIFFDIYDKYCDNDGFLIKEFSDGNVHIKDGKYISEFIQTNLS